MIINVRYRSGVNHYFFTLPMNSNSQLFLRERLLVTVTFYPVMAVISYSSWTSFRVNFITFKKTGPQLFFHFLYEKRSDLK